jgi:PAS domain S-box-containing protein
MWIELTSRPFAAQIWLRRSGEGRVNPRNPNCCHWTCFALLAADLIERNEGQAALRESREQFRWLASIVEFHDDAIVGKSLEGIIQSRNKGAERLFGYPAEEVIGKSITILIPVERQARSDNSSGSSGAVAIWNRSSAQYASPVDISLTVSPVRDEAEEIVGVATEAQLARWGSRVRNHASDLIGQGLAGRRCDEPHIDYAIKETIVSPSPLCR